MMKKTQGVTLLEILLVLVISSSLLVMFISFTQQKTDELRRNRVSLQMQQILNAGLAYYVANAAWPPNLATLQSGGYLPPASVKFQTPWGTPFAVNGATSATAYTGLFYVMANVKNSGTAQIVAGRLPLSFVSDSAGAGTTPPTQGGCAGGITANCTYVVAGVNIPGQNLNNASAVNFAGLYHNGACVPAPTCPVDKNGKTMRAAIYVVPASVSGINDLPTNCTNLGKGAIPINCKANVYPLSSFTAYAKGDANQNPASANPGPLDCSEKQTSRPFECNSPAFSDLPATDPSNTKYWRVCLSIDTEKGHAYPTNNLGNQQQGLLMGTVLAITRCVPNNGNEAPSGSAFDVWIPNQNVKP